MCCVSAFYMSNNIYFTIRHRSALCKWKFRNKLIILENKQNVPKYKKNVIVKLLLSRWLTYDYNTYYSATWSNYKTKSMDKLEIAFNNIFRILMGIGRRESKCWKINFAALKFVSCKYIVNLILRLDTLKNTIVITLYNWMEFLFRSIDFYVCMFYFTLCYKSFHNYVECLKINILFLV